MLLIAAAAIIPVALAAWSRAAWPGPGGWNFDSYAELRAAANADRDSPRRRAAREELALVLDVLRRHVPHLVRTVHAPSGGTRGRGRAKKFRRAARKWEAELARLKARRRQASAKILDELMARIARRSDV